MQGVVMKNPFKFLIAVCVLFAASTLAQEQGHLNIQTIVEKEEVVTNDEGETETRLVPATLVLPGDDVVYTITFRNVSEEAAENVVITNPIPEDLTYIDGSAFGPGTVIEFSADGGQSWSLPESLEVPDNGGTRAATAEDFTHLRWVMQNDLEAGAQGVARFRARLN